MTTATDTRTDREAYETMIRIEERTLAWQRANDATYAEIVRTMNRIVDLNRAIADLGMGRTTSFGTNSR